MLQNFIPPELRNEVVKVFCDISFNLYSINMRCIFDLFYFKIEVIFIQLGFPSTHTEMKMENDPTKGIFKNITLSGNF